MAALGQGTCNVTFNVAKAQAAILALIALRNKEAVSDFVRDAVEEKLEREVPEAALKWRAIRNSGGAFALLLIFAHCCWSSWQPGAESDTARRASSGARVVRNFRRLEMEEAV